MTRRAMPDHERKAIAAEINELLAQRGVDGRRSWTTTSLGLACGQLSNESIRKARDPRGVGHSVRDAILEVTGMTMEQLMAKHNIAPNAPRLPLLSEVTPYATMSAQARLLVRPLTAADRIAIARKMVSTLQEDGFPAEAVRGAVGELVLEDGWNTDLELYRAVRLKLKERGIVEGPARRPVREDAEAPVSGSSVRRSSASIRRSGPAKAEKQQR